MPLSQALRAGTVLPLLQGKTKEEVLRELALHLGYSAGLPPGYLAKKFLEREKIGSTGIGMGLAFPAARIPMLDGSLPLLAMGIHPEGVWFNSPDRMPVHLIMALVTPKNSPEIHLCLLAAASRMLRDEKRRERLMMAGTRKEVFCLVAEAEKFEKTRRILTPQLFTLP